MQKFAPQGIVAQQFSHAHIATAQQGDLVGLVGSMTVDSVGIIGAPIGQVATISDDKITWVVVELFASQIIEAVAAGPVTAGDQLKPGAVKNTVVTAPANDVAAFGRALNTAILGATVFVLPAR